VNINHSNLYITLRHASPVVLINSSPAVTN